ncbi:hypothetical protein INT44_006571 [Umbelopsis vinacea]|uniref:Carrier domain-containing protein n=1 Tax=Umbelopsis vinacea TaxID=44442 RepID=A0A8H7UH65_9FUNG|nr:hypothetical protein INT44_006571 [Umbelopsis vinacea]
MQSSDTNLKSVSNHPFNIHCFVGSDERIALGNSLLILLRAIPEWRPFSDDNVNAGMEGSLPVFVSLCGLLLFRYTSSPSFKMNVAYRTSCLQMTFKTVEFNVSITPKSSFFNLVSHVLSTLSAEMPNSTLPNIQDVLYININDRDNESPEIVEMSRTGGLYLHFIDIQDCFMTIFSFSNLLSSVYPNAINIKSHWLCMLNGLRTAPLEFANYALYEVPILESEERKTLFNVWNQCPHPDVHQKLGIKAALLQNLFERQASMHPENLAIVHEDPENPVRYTYHTANLLADVVARYINAYPQEKKKSRRAYNYDDEEMFIAHLFPRCAESYIAMLGILKSGSAYVPLDPAFPMERISYILQDCQAKFIITTSELGLRLKDFLAEQRTQGQIIRTQVLIWEEFSSTKIVDRDCALIDGIVTHKRNHQSVERPAYVIYTSGTTGNPKGCIIEHRSAVNLVMSESIIFPLSDKDVVFQNFSLAFDASIETIWLAFFNGATLYIPTEDMMHSGAQLAQFINQANVTVLSCVPTMLNMMSIGIPENESSQDYLLPTVKLLIVGGESCPKDVIEKWSLNGKRRMVNTYGPTEATVIATFGDCKPEDVNVTIGTVVPNYEVYILDAFMNPVPIGAIGELCIGGIGVARGYLNRPDLNQEKFVPNPFSNGSAHSQRLYKSGDLARFIPPNTGKGPSGLPAGSIEHLGRIDMQVKIRGFRVEISEIESVIVSCCEEVENAVVNVWKTKSDDPTEESVELLVAYLVLKDDLMFNEPLLKEVLKARLPYYMVPSIFQAITEIPTLPSGKINRKALPEPIIPKFDIEVPSSDSDLTVLNNLLTPTQRKVAQLWRTVLHLTDQTLELDSDFFELGGHSMVAAKFVSGLRALAEYRDVTMIDVYKYRKLEEFSERLEFYSQKSFGSSASINSESDTVLGSLPIRVIPTGPANVNWFLKTILMFISLYLVFTFASMQLMVPYLMYSYVNIESFTSIAASENLTITISDLLLHPTQNPNYDTLQNIYGARFDYSAFALMLCSLAITWAIYPIICIVAKWIIIGRFKPGVYPLYGVYYWRWWVVHRMTTMLPLSFFKGSPLLVYIYRAMGAKIGKNVYMGTGHVSCLDMVNIGDNTSIGVDVHLHGYTVKMGKKQSNGRYQGWLVIGPVEIGSNCYIGARTHLAVDSVVQNDVGIAEFSMVPEETVLKSGYTYAGSPIERCERAALNCEFAGIAENSKELYPDVIDPRRLPHWLAVCIQGVLVFGMMLAFMAALIPGSVSMVILINHPSFAYPLTSNIAGDSDERTTSVYWLVAMAVLLVVSFIFVLCLEIVAIKWLLLGRSKATRKIFHVDSWLYCRKWFVDCLMQLSLAMLHSMYATLFLPIWFRMLGSKIGKLAEVSTVFHCSPDRLVMKDGSFIADAAYLGPPRICNGWVQISDTIIGEKSFIGNSAFVPTGVEIKDNCLLGVSSRPPLTVRSKPKCDRPDTPKSEAATLVSLDAQEALDCKYDPGFTNGILQEVAEGTSWLGSPGLFLPNRATAAKAVSSSRTFNPPWYLYIARLSVEIWRVGLPTLIFGITSLVLFFATTYLSTWDWVNELVFWLIFPFAYILSAVFCCLLVALCKYVIMWKYVPREAPLWSFYVWRTELIGALEEALSNVVLCNHIRGTPFICWWFRLLGAKIGKNVWLETTMVTEADLLTIGDDCAIRADCTLQTHLFEDRIMKMSYLKIGNGCEIGAWSIALYDGVLEDGSHLGDFSLLMKGERFIENSDMVGIPAQPASRPKLL